MNFDSAGNQTPDIQANMLHIPLANETVGGIWVRASLVHMETQIDAQNSISELFRVLNRNGRIFVRVKARNVGEPETAMKLIIYREKELVFFRY